MKKILALILAAMFALSLCAPIAAANKLTFTIENATINAGETANVAVTVSNNAEPGFCSTSVAFRYDTATLSFGKLKNGGLFRAKDVTIGTSFIVDSDNVADDGTLLTIPVTVAPDAQPGEYTITLVMKDGVAYYDEDDGEFYDVDFAKVNGTITVPAAVEEPDPADAQIGISTTTEGIDNVSGNIVISDVPAGLEASKYVVTVNGVSYPVTDGKASFPISAKNLGDTINYTVTYEGNAEFTKAGTTTALAYYQALAASEDVKVAAVGSAMIAYAAAAEAQLKSSDATHNLTDFITDAPKVNLTAADKFDYSALEEALVAANAPVKYNAMNVSFKSETALLLAFKVIDGEADAAKTWIQGHLRVAGAALTDADLEIRTSGSTSFIIVKKSNIAVETICDVETAYTLAVDDAPAGAVSVLNYIAAMEVKYAGTTPVPAMLNLVRTLYAYSYAVADYAAK